MDSRVEHRQHQRHPVHFSGIFSLTGCGSRMESSTESSPKRRDSGGNRGTRFRSQETLLECESGAGKELNGNHSYGR
jgi:hypothetical protein